MDGHASDLTTRIAARLHGLRAERGYTLDELAARSGVSRSAISMIERNTTSPTAVILDKLATALAVPLASLFDVAPERAEPDPVARLSNQAKWRDPRSGYIRRSVSPPSWPSPIQIAEVELPAGAAVSFEATSREVEIHEQVWVLAGQLEVTVGPDTHVLDAADCLALRLDQPTAFRNPTDQTARYAVVVVVSHVPARRTTV